MKKGDFFKGFLMALAIAMLTIYYGMITARVQVADNGNGEYVTAIDVYGFRFNYLSVND